MNSEAATKIKVLAFAGSLRTGSHNKMLAAAAGAVAARAGVQVTVLDLRDFPMPIYDYDIERQGLPESALRFKQMLAGHDAWLIASPEYNSSIPGGLKNAIDWASRSAPGETPLHSFRGKTAALFSTSPGALGGLRGLIPLRSLLESMGVLVLPSQLAVPKSGEAFAADGSIRDAKAQAAVERIVGELVNLTVRLKA